MRIRRCGLPLLLHDYCCENEGGAMIETILIKMIYILLFSISIETIIVFALIIFIIILSK